MGSCSDLLRDGAMEAIHLRTKLPREENNDETGSFSLPFRKIGGTDKKTTMTPDPTRYHPGKCEATEWGKRYGKNLDSEVFDSLQHEWNLAKDKNWGPWSCCGNAANSLGCEVRQISSMCTSSTEEEINTAEGKKYIKFHNHGEVVGVASEEEKCWRLDNGRVAKKKTKGKAWDWHDGANKP
jgi:hypothetical protein